MCLINYLTWSVIIGLFDSESFDEHINDLIGINIFYETDSTNWIELLYCQT